ncbi:hypothetical protein [Azospirillum sp. ST 5-10]|uniref:hypothetical protein n=1 Tax=unclassified Azospirillum TaxID=2630922 RepID=UPI003F4A6E56
MPTPVPSAHRGGPRLGIRWTIGDVSPRGFEALRLSLWGAWTLFGETARYAVVVNSVGVAAARARTGGVPAVVEWRAAHGLPAGLAARLDEGMAEGVAWKFAPLRLFPDLPELSLDNDLVLWAMPEPLRLWLDEPDEGPFLLAEDVAMAFGRFARLCDGAPRNLGIRGLPPGFDLEAALLTTLERVPGPLTSELDEQGLQVAAMQRAGRCRAVALDDVTVCSPFWPHRPELGRCGAHFVGLNARHIPWSYYDRPATEVRIEHWEGHKTALARLVGMG